VRGRDLGLTGYQERKKRKEVAGQSEELFLKV
jgi:hypothetical protein